MAAETAGLVAGLLALASLFNTAVEDFEYIQFARNFNDDYHVCTLQLSNAQLRLSRWGKSIGLSDVDEETRSLRGTLVSRENVEPAQKLLNGILAELQRAKKKSAEYSSNNLVYDPESELDYSRLSLREIGRKLVRGRANRGLSKSKKIKWALHDRGHFQELIDGVSKLTVELVELFPAAATKQEELRDVEMREFTESLRQLQKTVSKQDELLAKSISRLLNPPSETFNFEIKDSQIGQSGRNDGTVNMTVNNHKKPE